MTQTKETSKLVRQAESKRSLYITTWNGARLVRDQAFLPTIANIVAFSKTHDIVRIGIIGDPSYGKTTLAEAITHALHAHYMEEYDTQFSVECFYHTRLHDVDDSFASLKPGNHIITLDDFNCEDIASKIMQVELAIRTMQCQDPNIKIILMCTYFGSYASDEYHRQEDFRYFMNDSGDELQHVQKITDKRFEDRVATFIEVAETAREKNKWEVMVSDTVKFCYKYKKPFVPCLFWNGQKFKNIATPTRKFIEKSCDICDRWVKMCYSDTPKAAADLKRSIR